MQIGEFRRGCWQALAMYYAEAICVVRWLPSTAPCVRGGVRTAVHLTLASSEISSSTGPCDKWFQSRLSALDLTLTIVDNKGKLSHWKRCSALINRVRTRVSSEQWHSLAGGFPRGSERHRGGGVQVLTSQVHVGNESPCLLCKNDLKEMKGAREQQRAPFCAPLKWDHSWRLAYECTFLFHCF